MLSIDPSLFPKLSTRKALIVVDAQSDFLDSDGALHVGMPADLTDRIVKLVRAFRPHGEVVWIRSEYDQPRSVTGEQIITSDAPGFGSRRPAPRGRRQQATTSEQPPSRCPEAFLSGPAPGRPECVRMDTLGADFPAEIKAVMEKKDISLVKTFYSAFKSKQLIQRLEMKFVNEVFICGSLSNMGVMATAIDAASHGLDIAVIEDCCGRRSSVRHNNALKKIMEATGCEVMSAEVVLDLVSPSVKPQPQTQPQHQPEPESQRPAAPPQVPATAPAPAFASAPAPTIAPAPLTPTKTAGRRYPVVYERSSGETSPTKLMSTFAKMSLGGQSDAGLPPITYIRAGAAARLARVLPNIENQFKGKGSISAMNASPNDDLNASSSETDDSSDEERRVAQAARVQPQTSAQRNVKNVSETLGSSTTKSDEDEKIGVEHAMRQLKLENEDVDRSDTQPGQLKDESAPSKEGSPQAKSAIPAVDISEVSTPVRTIDDHPSSSAKDVEDRGATMMEPNELNQTEGEPLCEGDTKVLYTVLPQPLSEDIFAKVRDEVQWLRMSHQGGDVPRLVAVQGEVDQDGNIPVYRHPADESPPLLHWTPAVKAIRDVAEKKVGHRLNHALIQFYRDGSDYISEHSDKTLDIAKGSFIVNISLGAERTMVLRTKRQQKQKDGAHEEATAESLKREIQRARLPHNSMCKMGLQTNMRWLHAIRQDKRLDREKSAEELAYGGARISLTFRQIGTFLDRDSKLIWGQGATAKSRDEAREVINGQTAEAVKMLQAFGRENHSTEFDWDEHYGAGFDVLNISASPRLFTSSDGVANTRVQLMLAEYGIGYAKGRLAPVSLKVTKRENSTGDVLPEDNNLPIKFIDNDSAKSTVHGDVAIMLYLDRFYNKSDKVPSQANLAQQYSRFGQALLLVAKLRSGISLKTVKEALSPWEIYAGEADFIAGSSISLVDFAFWPVLHDVVEGTWEEKLPCLSNLGAYYERIRNRESGIKVFGESKVIKEAPAKESAEEARCEPKTHNSETLGSKAPAGRTSAKRGREE